MKDPNSERDVQPLGLLDILRSVKDAMNLTNLSWLLYDEKRRTQWFEDLKRHSAEEPAQASADSESAVPSDLDDTNKPSSTKHPPRAAPVKRIETTDFNDRRTQIRRQPDVGLPLKYLSHDIRKGVGRRVNDG
jgi:hypothetical protein